MPIKQITSSKVHPGTQMKEGEWRFSSKARVLFHKFGGVLQEFWTGESLRTDGSNSMRKGSKAKLWNTEIRGDSYWMGDGSGVPYGSMYNDNIDTTVTIVSSGVAVRIPSGFTQGQVNLATFGNSREITVTKAGRYKIDWSISFNMAAGANHEIEGRIGINGSAIAQGSEHRFIGTRTDTGNMGGRAILDLAASAVVSLMMENDTNTEDIVVDHANLTLVMVGGT